MVFDNSKKNIKYDETKNKVISINVGVGHSKLIVPDRKPSFITTDSNK